MLLTALSPCLSLFTRPDSLPGHDGGGCHVGWPGRQTGKKEMPHHIACDQRCLCFSLLLHPRIWILPFLPPYLWLRVGTSLFSPSANCSDGGTCSSSHRGRGNGRTNCWFYTDRQKLPDTFSCFVLHKTNLVLGVLIALKAEILATAQNSMGGDSIYSACQAQVPVGKTQKSQSSC